jgi:hypothetical protein
LGLLPRSRRSLHRNGGRQRDRRARGVVARARQLAELDAVKGGIDLSLVNAAMGVARVVHHFANYVVHSSLDGNSIVVGGVYTVTRLEPVFLT